MNMPASLLMRTNSRLSLVVMRVALLFKALRIKKAAAKMLRSWRKLVLANSTPMLVNKSPGVQL